MNHYHKDFRIQSDGRCKEIFIIVEDSLNEGLQRGGREVGGGGAAGVFEDYENRKPLRERPNTT